LRRRHNEDKGDNRETTLKGAEKDKRETQQEEEHTSVLETSRLVDDFLAIFAV